MTRDAVTAILRGLPMPALMIAPDERILAANDQAEALLGSAIAGRHFITALRQPSVLEAIAACQRDRGKTATRYLGNDGAQDTTFNVTCSYVSTAPGDGMLICFEDITHVEQAGQMRRDFVANVSHELRTPLTALIGFIETLRGPARNDPAATDRFLGIMQDEAARMERLVRDLLSLSRVESEERVRPTDRVDLAQKLGTVLHALRPTAESTNVTLQADMPGGAVVVPGDADQLHQVFSNLIENAIKYGGRDRTVRVSIGSSDRDPLLRGPAVIISVSDEGPGIAEVHVPRLTERFYRIDTHRSREMGGTGLGLAIVKHIVNRHRGRLRVSSAPGKGSTFSVVLPR